MFPLGVRMFFVGGLLCGAYAVSGFRFDTKIGPLTPPVIFSKGLESVGTFGPRWENRCQPGSVGWDRGLAMAVHNTVPVFGLDLSLSSPNDPDA